MKLSKAIILALLIYSIFIGINILAGFLLPKYIDILVGFTVSMFICYRLIMYFVNKIE
jgi:hypothetical protein